MEDTGVSKTSARKSVRVRVPPALPIWEGSLIGIELLAFNQDNAGSSPVLPTNWIKL